MKFFTLNSYKEATMKSSLNGRASAISRILLTLTLALAFFAGDALAQCGGKTVYIKLPAGWGSTTYIMWEGGYKQITGTKEGEWTKFTLPTGLSNDAANKSEIIFLDYNNNNNQAAPISYITRRAIGSANNVPNENADKFTCSQFGDETYISDPTNSGVPNISNQPPNAYYFYFLPPNEEEWILGKPHLLLFKSGGAQEIVPFEKDEKCGWYKMVYFNKPVPTERSIIINSSSFNELNLYGQLGAKGILEEPSEWSGGRPTPIQLKTLFDNVLGPDTPGSMYFLGEGDQWYKGDGTRKSDGSPLPEQKSRCEYGFAAYIYYRTVQENTDGFSWYNQDAGAGTTAEGLCRGLVKETLGPDGKMQWNGNKCNSDWKNETNFKNAFQVVANKSAMRCWDMPFQQRPNGLWEFDAYYLCKDDVANNAYMDYNSGNGTGCRDAAGSTGGFYPGIGPRNPYTGDRIGVAEDTKWCYDRGWYGTGTGDLSNARTAAEVRAVLAGTCTREFREGELISDNDPIKFDFKNTTGVKGGHMCFESQDAEFIYEPGQEFFFRGDDDIWVFLSNYLVIDLGGNHMPAPGYVKLDAVRVPAAARITGKEYEADGAFKPGQSYPLKIFFCDRRGPGANVRITTNMYFSQKSGLQVEGNPQTGDASICVINEGSSAGCNPSGSGSGLPTGKTCGKDIAGFLEYYMVKRGTDIQIPLANGASKCTMQPDGNKLVCYGGINIFTKDAKVNINTKADGSVNVTDLSGTYTIYVKHNTSGESQRIGMFSVDSKLFMVWDKIYTGDFSPSGTLIRDLGPRTQNHVTGKLIPVGIALGTWKNDDSPGGEFLVDATGVGGSFRLTNSSLSDPSVQRSTLKVYKDSTGSPESLVDPNEVLNIPASGLAVLWVTGDYIAEDDATYIININNVGDPVEIKFWLPRLAFINPATENTRLTAAQAKYSDPDTDPVTGNPRKSLANSWVWLPGNLPRTVGAFDVSGNPEQANGQNWQGVLCSTCKFQVRGADSWGMYKGVRADEGLLDIEAVDITNGKGIITVNASDYEIMPDSFAFFRVKGPSNSEKTYAKWDSLTFRLPPVPVPILAEIFVTDTAYAKSGGGIGDSIRIHYNRPFDPDSLPNYVEVKWDPENIIGFGLAKPTGGQYSNELASNDPNAMCVRENNQCTSKYVIDTTKNREYWKNPANGRNIVGENGRDSIIVIRFYDGFGEDIKTAPNRNGINDGIVSWATFEDIQPGGTVILTTGSPTPLRDSIPPIVIAARYEAGVQAKCGSGSAKDQVCQDRVIITLSEPIKAFEPLVEPAAYEIPFAYKLIEWYGETTDFSIYANPQDLPIPDGSNIARMDWTPSRSRVKPDVSLHDSIVSIVYGRYKTVDGTFANTPMPGDWVKFAYASNLSFVDAVGNKPNGKEWGRQLEGEKPFTSDKIPIADLDPNKDALKDALERLSDELGLGLKYDDIFDKGKNQVTVLPVPEGWTIDDVRKNYPGSIGQVFKPDVANKAGSVDPDSITFYAKAYYHTNLATYVTHGEQVKVKCSDERFKINGEGDCKSNKMGFYLAWNLKDAKNRWVGAGAYVELYDFYWEIPAGRQDAITQKIEMLGVKRIKSKK
jgi:fibro-slime domain-containing protein